MFADFCEVFSADGYRTGEHQFFIGGFAFQVRAHLHLDSSIEAVHVQVNDLSHTNVLSCEVFRTNYPLSHSYRLGQFYKAFGGRALKFVLRSARSLLVDYQEDWLIDSIHRNARTYLANISEGRLVKYIMFSFLMFFVSATICFSEAATAEKKVCNLSGDCVGDSVFLNDHHTSGVILGVYQDQSLSVSDGRYPSLRVHASRVSKSATCTTEGICVNLRVLAGNEPGVVRAVFQNGMVQVKVDTPILPNLLFFHKSKLAKSIECDPAGICLGSKVIYQKFFAGTVLELYSNKKALVRLIRAELPNILLLDISRLSIAQ